MPEGQVVRIVVHMVGETFLDQQPPRVVGQQIARQPACRPGAGRPLDRGSSIAHEGPLLRLFHAELVNPAMPVGADLVPARRDPRGELRRTLQRHRRRGEGRLQPALFQQPHHPGRACLYAVGVVAFVAVVADRAPRAGAQFVHGLGIGVAVVDAGLRAFLDIHHQGERDPRPAGPGRPAPIAVVRFHRLSAALASRAGRARFRSARCPRSIE